MRLTALCAALTLGWGCAASFAAELSEEEELALGFGEKSVVSIATGSQLPMARAPSVATVITADDIKARVSGNLGHQRSVDKTSGQDAGMAPHDHVNLRADWRFVRGWRSNAQLDRVGERKRQPGDARAPLAGYTTVDLTLRTEPGSSPWEFAVSVRNLFDADAREPSPFGVPFVPIPNDFPLPGRSVYVEARYRLELKTDSSPL